MASLWGFGATMYEVSTASSGSKVTFGILAALWAASNGMGAITEALNIAYNVKETRPWWKQRLTAEGLTIERSSLTCVVPWLGLEARCKPVYNRLHFDIPP